MNANDLMMSIKTSSVGKQYTCKETLQTYLTQIRSIKVLSILLNFKSKFSFTIFILHDILAYTSKGCTPIQVLPVPNAHTISQQTTGVFLLSKCIFCCYIGSFQVIFSMFFFRMWCTHQGQEVPQLGYTPLTRKLVDTMMDKLK